LLKPDTEAAILPGVPSVGHYLVAGTSLRKKDGRETQAMKALTIVATVLALLVVPAHAQMGKRGQGGGDTKKDDSATKKVDDKAYKAALERIPDPKEKYDPWGVTKPAADPAKKPK
jgi:hypothetical protein